MPYKNKKVRNAKLRENYAKKVKPFYTYVWFRKDGTPYYVGKGKGDRGFTSSGHRLKCPSKEYISIQYWPDEATAFAYEIYQIDFWGRKDLHTGCLRNLSDGGENPPKGLRKGSKMPEWLKEKLVSLSIGRTPWNKGLTGYHIHTEESKAAISKTHLGKPKSAAVVEGIRKRSIGNTYAVGRKHSEEAKELLRKNHNHLSNLGKDHQRGKDGKFKKNRSINGRST